METLTKSQSLELKAKELINKRTDKELLMDWVVLDEKEVTLETAKARGWLMDEIEKRWPLYPKIRE